MVRKKLKKPHGAASHGHSSPSIDPAEVVMSWLKDLQLLENNSIPSIGLNMSHFDMAQVDGIRTLRKAVLAGENIEEAQLRMLILASMLLYIDPLAYALRKSLGDLLLAIHETNPLQCARTDEILVTKFVDLAWRIGERCRATCSRESMVDAMGLARSLQWLLDVPGAGRVFVDYDSGLQLGRSVACLGLMMETQAAVLQDRPDDGIHHGSYAEADAVMEHGKVDAVGVPLNKRVSVDVHFYCEILKAASSLFSFAGYVDTDKLPGGDAAVRRMCEICLLLLSNATVHRETITHASAVLIHLTIAYWRAHGRWPGDPAVPSVVGIESAMDRKECSLLKVALSMIVESLFADDGSGQSADMMGELIVAFMPLPPSSTLAVCRALMHIASPHILLATYDSSCGTLDNLFTGPILHVILRNGDADKGLQVRFFALQVLETWCSKAAVFAEAGLSFQDPSEAGSNHRERYNEEQPNIRHALSKITDIAVAALMHPSRFISSMAPSLLEHTVNLRHRVCTNQGRGEEMWDWGSLMEQVLEQPASNKGKYVALGVLLPRIGALQAITLCPSLVKQLVCAVGIRGNVSGQASSLLLQLLESLKQEIRAKTDKADMLELEVIHACRGYWVGAAAAALTQADAWSRNHVADYLLPEMFKFDPGSAARLCSELRSRGHGDATLLGTASPCLLPDDTNESAEPEVRQMWAMMEIARLGRKSGLMPDLTMIGGQAGDASSGLLQLHEVEWAALHADEDLRISALSLLCTDARVTTVPVAAETELLRKVLPYSLKVFTAQNRQTILRAMQTLLIRIRETVRVCSKRVNKAKSRPKDCQASDFAKAKGQGGSDTLTEHGQHIYEASEERPRTGAMESPDGTVKRVKDFLRFLCQMLTPTGASPCIALQRARQAILRSLYPGCPFEREVLGLEIVQLVLSELQPSNEAHAGKPDSNSLSQVVTSSLFCRRWVDTLLNLLGSSWERTRSLSYAILSRFPRPLPGYDPLNGATRLASEGLRLTGSGRQRESDRGALILRLVFGAYARDLGLNVPLVALEAGRWSRAESNGVTERAKRGGGSDATVGFLVELCAIMSLRLDGMERSFNVLSRRQTNAKVDDTSPEKEMASSLLHGLFLAAHHVLVDSRRGDGSRADGRKQRRRSKPRTSDPNGDVVDLNSRREAMGILLECTFRALRLSQLIVGDDGEGNDRRGHMREEGSTKHSRDSGGSGPDIGTVTASLNLNHSVNANGHVGMVSVDYLGRSVPPPVHRGDGEAEKINDAEAGCDVQNADAVEGQRAVVGAWLLAKEACRCLATMVTASPLPLEDDETNKEDTCGVGPKALLTVENVTDIGETLLRSMLSFKHMGCIVSAQNAFQTVCESVLHSSEHNGILSGLPSVWLEKLLREPDGAGQEFVLKRSAGLALAFMSLFRAEPRSVAPVLLPRGMSVLLALAGTSQKIEDLPSGTEIDDETRWNSTVTALNVLRQAFVDAPLADDIAPYVTQATKAAVRGFEHPTWAVRNSSMMLFASIMQRAVGGAKNVENLHALGARRPHSAKAAVTAEDFFKQHKQLHPFLLSQLETAADEMCQVHSTHTRRGASGRGRAEMHPALYPILLLLARLRSRGAEATVMQMEVGEQVYVDPRAPPTAAFVPAVIRCARNPHFLARATSARALAALVPPPESFSLVHDLMRSLPKSAEALAQVAGTYNFVHGTLLQVQELLLVARAVRDSGQMLVSSAMSDHEDKKRDDLGVSNELSEDTVNAILDRVWLADPQVVRCPPVRHAMLLVLRALEQSGEYLRGGVNDRVLTALRSTEELNLTDVIRAEHAGRFVPGNPLLGSAVVDATIRRRLERIFGTILAQVDKDESKGAAEIEFVVGLLCSSDVNVRDAAIKSAKKFFGDREGIKMFTAEDQDALQQLWAGVAKALAVEAYQPNVRRLVRLFCRIGLKLNADRQLVSPEPLWCLLRKLCYDISNDVRAAALEAMGHIVRLGERDTSYSSKLEEYVSLLESAVAPDQPVLTAATSLAVSEVLSCFLESSGDVDHRWKGSDEGLATIYVRFLFVALVLLQDDDQRVRASAAYTWAKATNRPSLGRNSVGVVALSIGRGARVDIRATENILERLAALSLSESVGGKGSVAKQFASDLMRAIEEISRIDVGGLLMALSGAGAGEGNVWEDGGGGLIFDKEDKKRFHEPVPFACIAGPYLKTALVAIRTRGGVVPQSVTLALARVLNGLSDALEALAGSPRDAPRLTWLPAVYQGIVASAATGEAAVGHLFAGGAVLCSDEIARALEACKKLNEVLGREAGLHPEVLSAVERMVRQCMSEDYEGMNAGGKSESLHGVTV